MYNYVTCRNYAYFIARDTSAQGRYTKHWRLRSRKRTRKRDMETVSGRRPSELTGSPGRKMRKMRARVIKKFTSAEGMTILIALLFFMMCAVVGSIILTAATAASGRLSSLRKEEKGYYAAGSVAQFLEDSIEGATFQKSQTDDQDPIYTMNGETVVKADQSSDALINLILNTQEDTDVTYAMTAAPTNSASSDNTIKADIKMQRTDGYQIRAVITTADGYKLSLVIPYNIDTQTITNTENVSGGTSSTGGGTSTTGEEGTSTTGGGTSTTGEGGNSTTGEGGTSTTGDAGTPSSDNTPSPSAGDNATQPLVGEESPSSTTEAPASTETSPAAGTGTGEGGGVSTSPAGDGGGSVTSGSQTTTVVHVTTITTVTWSGGRITATG